MANNTPHDFEDPAFMDETDNDETDDRYLLPDERPFIGYLNTEDKNFEQE